MAEAWISGSWSVTVNGQERRGRVEARGSAGEVAEALRAHLVEPLVEALAPPPPRPRRVTDVTCPICRAEPRRRCRSLVQPGGPPIPAHRERYEALEEALYTGQCRCGARGYDPEGSGGGPCKIWPRCAPLAAEEAQP